VLRRDRRYAVVVIGHSVRWLRGSVTTAAAAAAAAAVVKVGSAAARLVEGPRDTSTMII